MYTLFIDTHDKLISMCLYKDGKTLEISQKESFQNHTDFVMPMIDSILKNNNIDVHSLGEIFVVTGPGSFTGVRIGVTIAKMLAYTLNIPIKTINSIEMYAVSNEIEDDKLVILHDIKGVFGALFDSNNKVKIDYFYKSNDSFNEFVKENNLESKIVDNLSINFDLIYNYIEQSDSINPHAVNPIYIKTIEALK